MIDIQWRDWNIFRPILQFQSWLKKNSGTKHQSSNGFAAVPGFYCRAGRVPINFEQSGSCLDVGNNKNWSTYPHPLRYPPSGTRVTSHYCFSLDVFLLSHLVVESCQWYTVPSFGGSVLVMPAKECQWEYHLDHGMVLGVYGLSQNQMKIQISKEKTKLL